MKLGDFHSLIAREIARGTTYDAQIPDYTRRAALWIERNYSFKWTERFVQFTLNPEDTYPRSVSIPDRLKAIEFIRFYPGTLDADGDGVIDQREGTQPIYAFQCDAKDIDEVPVAIPTRYWQDSTEYLWFDAIPSQVLVGQMSYYQYTEWPTDPEAEPLILTLAEDLMLAQTIILMAPMMRNPLLREMYEPMRVEALRTLIVADEALRNSNRDEYMDWRK